VLAVFVSRQKSGVGNAFSIAKIFPWFILGFLAASIISTFGWLSPATCKFLGAAGKFCIILAMAAIGLNTHLRQLLANGFKPILLGFSCWLAVSLVSLGLQKYLQLW
jgi:uncharacterized membrane protein YadS